MSPPSDAKCERNREEVELRASHLPWLTPQETPDEVSGGELNDLGGVGAKVTESLDRERESGANNNNDDSDYQLRQMHLPYTIIIEAQNHVRNNPSSRIILPKGNPTRVSLVVHYS